MITVHIIVKGLVQGVFYRATAQKQAKKLGVTGWVKNTKDGHVEAMVTGSESQVESFVEWCKQGPSNANVTGLEQAKINLQKFDDFTILRT